MIFPYRLRHVVTQMATGTRQQDKVDKDNSGKIRCESCSKLRFCPILPRAQWFIYPLSSCGKTNRAATRGRGPESRLDRCYCPLGLIGTNCVESPRLTSSTAARFGSSLDTSALNCLGSFTSVLFKRSITSPGRQPARAAAPSTPSTITPPSVFSSFLCAWVSSPTAKPSELEGCAGLGFFSSFLAMLSASISTIVNDRSRLTPKHQTNTKTHTPNKKLPTSRGRSLAFSIGVPLNFRMMA